MTQPQNPNLPNRNPGQKSNDVIEIDLREVFGALWSHLGSIIIAGLLCAIIALAGTMFLVHPTYRAGFTSYVNNKNGTENTTTMQNSDVTASQSLTYTYAAIMKSRSVVEDALESAELTGKYTYADVSGAISTSTETNTQLLNLYVTLEDAEDAYQLASAIADIAPDYVSDIVEGSSMKIVVEPNLPISPYSPNTKKNTAVGFAVGAVLMILWVLFRMITDNRIKGEAQLEEKFGIPVIGSIPNVDEARKGKSGYAYGKKSGQKRSRKIAGGEN